MHKLALIDLHGLPRFISDKEYSKLAVIIRSLVSLLNITASCKHTVLDVDQADN